jgi:hypothetical protein
MICPNLTGRRRACASNHVHGPCTVTRAADYKADTKRSYSYERGVDGHAVVLSGTHQGHRVCDCVPVTNVRFGRGALYPWLVGPSLARPPSSSFKAKVDFRIGPRCGGFALVRTSQHLDRTNTSAFVYAL